MEKNIMIKWLKLIRKNKHAGEPAVYYKPNMSNLHGKAGKSIIETIRNTSPAPKDGARKKVEEYKENIIKVQKNQ